MAMRFGRGGRFIDHVVGTDEDDELFGYAMGESPLSDIMSDTLEGGRGDDFLFGGGGADTLRGGRDDDTLEGGTWGDVLDGGEGFDTALFWHSRSAVYINLVAGAGYAGEADGDTFISIEKVVGSEHDDVIVGDHDGNVIDGWIGDDRIWGGDGTDTLYGDLGIDRLYGGGGLDHLYGGSSTDYLRGEGGIDFLDGEDGDDFLYGGGDQDFLYGSRGVDTNYGGEGRDLVDYSGRYSSGAVTVNLETGRGFGGFAEGDLYDGIESVVGSRWGDTITGDGGANYLGGEEGVDVLSGGVGDDELQGGAGADQLDGGPDNDTAVYIYSSAGVRVDLSRGGGQWGDADGDKFVRVENVTGSRFSDVLIGDRGDNVLSGYSRSSGGALAGDELRGNEGNDRLFGGWYNDTIWGGAGADYIDGGGGDDCFIYSSVSDSTPSAFGAPATYDEIKWNSIYEEIDLSRIDANTTAAAPGNDLFTFSPFSDVFTGAGQLRIERHDDRSFNVLGETTGDGVADLMIRVSGSIHLDASDIHILM